MGDTITPINAKPESIETFLGNRNYTIPDYQRPYSWGKEECAKLWGDLIEYYQDGELDTSYFLGSIVFYNENNEYFIIDGQQRLITLSLFMRALLQNCTTFSKIEKIIFELDEQTGDVKVPRSIKIKHCVLGKTEDQSLKDAMLLNTGKDDSKYIENYDYFKSKIEEYFKKDEHTADKIENFILYIIKNVILLPIECTNTESALTIFETINNRGLDLTDADIFKSKLYKHACKDALHTKEIFVEEWDTLTEDLKKSEFSLKDLFTHYMHVLRGQEGEVDSITSLRKFFDKKNSLKENRLKDWKSVMLSLNKINFGWKFLSNSSLCNDNEILNWYLVIKEYPNAYWQYPIAAFMHENIEENNGQFSLEQKHHEQLLSLIKETTKYCYLIWLKHRSVANIKDTIFKSVRSVVTNIDGINEIYKTGIQMSEKDDHESGRKGNLKNILLKDLRKGSRGMCLLTSLLSKQQDRAISENWQIEHILPKKWHKFKYENWDDNKFKKHHDILANMIALEKILNIRAGNQFYSEKIEQYQKSDITYTQSFPDQYKSWTPKELQNRQDQIVDILFNFFYSG